MFSDFMVYASIYRTSVLLVGALSIYLGYRLFDNRTEIATRSESDSPERSEFSLRTEKVQLMLRSTTPGIFFALFGIVLISAMTITGNPELQIKSFSESGEEIRSIYLRNAQSDAVETFLDNFRDGYYDENPFEALNEIVDILEVN